jgi:predicted unusual protein kinase regulating ubiquinone biosynthesis (AarF/ABC1/UbiB family)
MVPSDISFHTIRAIIEKDLGTTLESVFSEFQEEPIGAASIGQVHKAKLLSGRTVAGFELFRPAHWLF